MLSLDDTFWGDRGDGSEEPIPFLTGDLVPTAEEVDQLVAYLGRHFGPGTSQRMLLNDEQVALDEEALGKAMWIEYTAPDVSPGRRAGRKVPGTVFSTWTETSG